MICGLEINNNQNNNNKKEKNKILQNLFLTHVHTREATNQRVVVYSDGLKVSLIKSKIREGLFLYFTSSLTDKKRNRNARNYYYY